MQRRSWTFRVVHILDAIARAQRYTAGLTLEEFESNELVIDALIRTFAVIGEAAQYIPSDVVARYPQLPIAEMRAMRNVVVHNYDNVRLVTLWETVRDDLPPLVSVLQDILEREADGDAYE